MNKLLLLDSSYPINTRNSKLAETLTTSMNAVVEVCAWDRELRSETLLEGYYLYRKYSRIGSLKQKLCNLYGYYRFIRKVITQHQYNVLIASHWDMLFLAACLKQKGQLLVYENLDIPTHRNRWVLKVLLGVEKWALKKTDSIVFASRFFAPLYASFKGKKFIIENKPLIATSSASSAKHTSRLIVSYIGLVRYIGILKNLVDAILLYDDVDLYIHGEGQDLEELRQYASASSRVHFTGRYEQHDLPRLYAGAHVVWAAYPNKDYNVKYAISNKYHESIAYKVPCIFAERTELGRWVSEKKIGIVVDPYEVSSIAEVIARCLSDETYLMDIAAHLQIYSAEEKTWSEQVAPLVDYLETNSPK